MLEVRRLSKSFHRGGALFRGSSPKKAVDQVSFVLRKGKTLAIVGESGSGKSTTARLCMRLLQPDEGEIFWNDIAVHHLHGRQLRRHRRHIQMVFQDPFASLNPRMRIWETVAEGLRVHEPGLSRAKRRERVAETLERCGIDAATMDRYPHQFSGGQRQRIGIARALIVEPRVLVLDEPVSALDVSVQAQILNLLNNLRHEHELSYLFISHDLSVVRHVADEMLVMFAGRVVEEGDVESIYTQPRHPYTAALLKARPVAHPRERVREERLPETGQEQVAATGCPYRLRCLHAREDCMNFDNSLVEKNGRRYACLHPLG